MTLSKTRTTLLLCALSIGALSACGASSVKSSGPSSAPPLAYNADVLNGKMAPPKGLMNDNLFSQKIRNSDERFERLENAVQALHTALSTYLPAIEKLSAIEGDIQELVVQLQTLVSEPALSVDTIDDEQVDAQFDVLAQVHTPPTTGATPPPAPEVTQTQISEAEKPAAPAVSKAASAPAGNNIRVSQGPDKTRVVFDTPNKTDYTLDYDAQENVILVTAKNADFSASFAEAAKKSKLIQAISATRDGELTTIVFELQGASSISNGASLPPSGGNAQHRYYFDIF